ncbi:MAG TPA: Fic family protein [Bacteroidales bacterium]|nr:Fic family protein [Bacteroidales bacterium]HNZ42919.1 Fic family protein [Bacteroidales bacterium]HOH84413.1 Fic family protein [Bacteroidales bacterium]HPI31419.1 Fic family protein [Bacteroidales bacterium]HQN17271.1 Fic family protein [Bacteroidales bacterium]
MAKYIYQYPDWPDFYWDEKEIQVILGTVRHLQGRLWGQINALGFSIKEENTLTTLTLDVLKSSEIEGEILNYDQVRSSIARKLGLKCAGMVNTSRYVDGVVEMMLDATQHYRKPLDEERLFGWHAALFPTGRSGMYKIDTACYRKGEMQVVSGAMGKEKIHFQAPPPARVPGEMKAFLKWLNKDTKLDMVLKSAIAHFWFIIIHPFDDGNGRIARAISDLLLTRSDESPQRFYSLSNQILKERKLYYKVLQKVQFSDGDITEWLVWFLHCLYRALQSTEESIQGVIRKAEFWDKHKETLLNSRQRLMLNKLFDGFDGKLKTSKWAKMAKCSPDTALRDIKDLMDKGILKQEKSGGRSTNYILNL